MKKYITEKERLATWWISWEDLNWPNADNLERIKAHAEALAKADVSAVVLFGTHFRWDWMPFFPILHDYIATVAEELHSYGVKLYDAPTWENAPLLSAAELYMYLKNETLPADADLKASRSLLERACPGVSRCEDGHCPGMYDGARLAKLIFDGKQ